ncbi:hypothetical protein [Pedobacter borealis]|uniref:hypothetical protein n=1 Tax=Pedobacter borealis TaxID=475254 RepID=UPI000B130D6A|nr:hypothetical protein [Pedobacter borealis]
MKIKKLEKKTVFVFKKNNLTNLTKEQMRRIYGGDSIITDDRGGASSRVCHEAQTQSQ